MACDIYNYKNKSYSEEDIKPIVSYHYAVEDRLLMFDDIVKVDKVIQTVDNKLVTAKENIEFINESMGLGNEIVTVEDSTGIITIDVNPVADMLLNVVPSDNIENETIYRRKTYNLQDIDQDTMEDFENKANLMEQRFAEIGITSHIILDGDIKDSGQLLGTESARYKEMLANDEISDGDAVIIINPRNLYSDTVFHEYGHLFIDLAGGMNNPRIKYAYAKIKNSPLSSQVKEMYPELNEDMLAKEIMATAIGKEANEIFNAGDQNIGFIQRFIDWIRDTIKGLIGIPNNSVKSLANELLTDVRGLINEDVSLSTDTQLFKGSKEAREARRKNTKFVTGAKASLESIKRRMNNLRGEIGKSTDKNKVNFKNQLDKLNEELDAVLSKSTNLIAVNKFIERTEEIADSIITYLQDLKDKTDNEKLNIEYSMLAKVDLFESLFSIVKDVKANIREGYFEGEFKAEGWNKENSKAFIDRLDVYESKYNRILELRNDLGKHHIANKLVPYSNRMTIERRVELEKEFKQQFPYTVQDGSRTKYNAMIREKVNNQIAEELPQLKKDERKWLYDRLTASPVDVGSFAKWVNSEKDLNSAVIQLASKMIDESDLRRDQDIINILNDAEGVYKEFAKEASGQDPKDIYKGMYQEGSDGQLYITTKYSIEWFIQRQKLANAYMNAKETYGKESEEANAAQKVWQAYDKENSIAVRIEGEKNPIYRPNDKWLNKDYKAIQSSPGKAKLLAFLHERFKNNHKRLHGNNSLLVNSTNSDTIFIKAPSVGRSLFEKVASGEAAAGIKDWAERLFKVKTDETDVIGEVNNQEVVKNTMKTLANSKGDIKHGVPIHFRGKMKLNEISYDLLSSAMLDTHMATNYFFKSAMQVELELMKDIVSNKKFTKTQGFAKKVLLNGLNKKEAEELEKTLGKDSNELEVLNSIIENRLYGIKTANTEYAKFASTLMSWTASSMLMFNIPSGIANALQGKVFNFIEAAAGEFFDVSNLKAAEFEFFKDMEGWINDIGRPVQKAKTNQMLNLLNLQGEFKTLAAKFTEDNRFKALAKANSGYAFNHMGEFYMHATLMYAIMDRIKIQNSKREYIDKDGKVVKTAAKAMTLSEAITLDKKGNLELNKHVYYTNFGNSTFSLTNLKQDKGLLEVKNLVNKIAHDLHGNYNEEYQAMGQRYIVGKMVSMFRKWIVPGFNRRWRGAVNANTPTDELRNEVDNFYSEDLQAFQEGYYTTGIRLFNMIRKDIKQLGFEAISANWNNLSDRELANMRRLGVELGILAISLASSYLLYALAKDIDDPIEREMIFYTTYFTRRMFSELSFYSNPIEAFKIMRDPSATLAYVGKLGKFLDQLGTDTINTFTGQSLEEYEQGRNKGQFKLWKRTRDLVPAINQYYRDIEETTSWMFNVY